MRRDVHDGHARDLQIGVNARKTLVSTHLAYPAPQVAIACRHDVALVLLHALHQAIVCIRALVGARDALHPGVLECMPLCVSRGDIYWAHLGNLQRHLVLLAQLLQLGHDAIRDAGKALGIQAVDHALHKVNLRGRVLYRVWTGYARTLLRMEKLIKLVSIRTW